MRECICVLGEIMNSYFVTFVRWIENYVWIELSKKLVAHFEIANIEFLFSIFLQFLWYSIVEPILKWFSDDLKFVYTNLSQWLHQNLFAPNFANLSTTDSIIYGILSFGGWCSLTFKLEQLLVVILQAIPFQNECKQQISKNWNRDECSNYLFMCSMQWITFQMRQIIEMQFYTFHSHYTRSYVMLLWNDGKGENRREFYRFRNAPGLHVLCRNFQLTYITNFIYSFLLCKLFPFWLETINVLCEFEFESVAFSKRNI